MEALHIANAHELESISNEIGFPLVEVVGNEASASTWYIIQHAISVPSFMKDCAVLLHKAAIEGKASMVAYAYLSDRIAVFEGKPQLYGMQFDWDESGQLSPMYFDSLELVNERRASLGMIPLTDQITVMRERVSAENQRPPEDLEQRRQEELVWKRRVGWGAV